MSHFDGITLAFSHKEKVWRTRYSFTPTAYATIDNTFISCNGVHPTGFVENGFSDLVWKQDSNSTHSNFSGFQYDMSVAFVANYNPSSVKMFKSLSAESNSNNWKGFVSTNQNPAGSDQSEFQRGELNEFTRKEGVSYVDIPVSEANSTSHILTGFKSFFGVSGTQGGWTNSNASTVNISNNLLLWDLILDQQLSHIPVGESCFVLVRDDQGNLSYLKQSEIIPMGSETPSADEGFAFVYNFDAVNSVVTLGMKLFSPTAVPQAPFFPSMWGFGLGEDGVYIETPAKSNGDYMRGQYLNVYLSNNSVAPVECLAFNVNYEPTKLDHSLGQNA